MGVTLDTLLLLELRQLHLARPEYLQVLLISLYFFLRKLPFDIGIKTIPETALPLYQFYVLLVVRKYFQLRE